MENNEIMATEEIMEVTDEITVPKTRSAGKIALGVGVTALVGFGIYKAAKAIYKKVKAAKSEASDENVIEVSGDDVEIVEE